MERQVGLFLADALPRLAGAAAALSHDHVARLRTLDFVAFDAATWPPLLFPLWLAVLWAALLLLSALVLLLGGACACGRPRIRARGRPLARFALVDERFVLVNKLVTSLFTYHALRYCALCAGLGEGASGGGATATGVTMRLLGAPVVASDLPPVLAESLPPFATSWLAPAASAAYTLACMLLLYVVYDVFYMPFHFALHHPSVYAQVHKHHHRSAAPHRGNLDAINVHPLEFALGEYNHLLSAHLCALLLAALGLPPLHAGAVAAFVVLGGVLASLNHTRFDVRLPLGLFSVAWHDVHHHRFAHNYGQYSMAVDRLLGTFLDAPEDSGAAADLREAAAARAATSPPADAAQARASSGRKSKSAAQEQENAGAAAAAAADEGTGAAAGAATQAWRRGSLAGLVASPSPSQALAQSRRASSSAQQQRKQRSPSPSSVLPAFHSSDEAAEDEDDEEEPAPAPAPKAPRPVPAQREPSPKAQRAGSPAPAPAYASVGSGPRQRGAAAVLVAPAPALVPVPALPKNAAAKAALALFSPVAAPARRGRLGQPSPRTSPGPQPGRARWVG